jgi:hypothetical protein
MLGVSINLQPYSLIPVESYPSFVKSTETQDEVPLSYLQVSPITFEQRISLLIRVNSLH